MKIFTKIFISFWIAQALFFVLVVLVTWVIRQQAEAGTEAAQSKMFNEAVLAYEQGGIDSLHKYFESVRQSQHIRGILLNEQGDDVNGRQTPEWIRTGVIASRLECLEISGVRFPGSWFSVNP